MNVKRMVCCLSLAIGGGSSTSPAWAFDPLLTDPAVPPTVVADVPGASERRCAFSALPIPLRLQDAVERALCNHPKTREAWANVKIQAAAVGMARAAWLPTINGNWQGTRDVTSNHVTGYPQYDSNYRTNLQNASVSLGWVLYDFGRRSAALSNATALLAAAQANRLATLQTVFATVAKDFYAAQAAQGMLAAAWEVERNARAGADAAAARVDRGVAPVSDRLQAQTAYVEAVVNRTKAESDLEKATGTLASDMNIDPTTRITLPDVGDGVQPDREFGDSVAALIDDAQQHYPGVVAARAQLAAARAKAAQTRAEGSPRVNLIAQYAFNNQPTSLQLGFPVFPATHREWYLGLQVAIPIFAGFARTYQVKQADARAELQADSLAEVRRQVGLDVWVSYQSLQGATKNLSHSANLLTLAHDSHEAAQRRYQIGATSILELLHAQSTLAHAQQQRIRALTEWRSARLQLASKLGRLGMWSIDASWTLAA